VPLCTTGKAVPFNNLCRNFSWKLKFKKHNTLAGFRKINLSGLQGDNSINNELQSIKTANQLGFKLFTRIEQVELFVNDIS